MVSTESILIGTIFRTIQWRYDPDFKNPTSPKVVNMISAIRQIVNSYGSNFILSWAPETFYLQMGNSFTVDLTRQLTPEAAFIFHDSCFA